MDKSTAPLKSGGGHKYRACEFIKAYLKDCYRGSEVRPTIPELWILVDDCRPTEIDLENLLLTRKGPLPLKQPDNKKLAAWHILWFMLPFVRQEKANDLADLMLLMNKCIPTQLELSAIVKWWSRRHPKLREPEVHE